jgi:hypothetical protein
MSTISSAGRVSARGEIARPRAGAYRYALVARQGQKGYLLF